jgi:hypothetical protein
MDRPFIELLTPEEVSVGYRMLHRGQMMDVMQFSRTLDQFDFTLESPGGKTHRKRVMSWEYVAGSTGRKLLQ